MIIQPFLFRIVPVTVVVFLFGCNSTKQFNPKDIPQHSFFIKRDIAWQTSPYGDTDYMKAIGQNATDTMVILTHDKFILITGQYGLKPGDTVIMPYSGEFGINYEVLQNNNYKLFQDTIIKIRGEEFISTSNAKFEWW